ANEEANRSRREVLLLHQMGELLQSCATLDDAFSVFQSVVGQFFPEDAGAVYVIAASRNLAEPVVIWGFPPGQSGSAGFPPDECWDLRRGRAPFAAGESAGLGCQPAAARPRAAALSLPQRAPGDAVRASAKSAP